MVAFVGFSRIVLQGILIFNGLSARRLYKLFAVQGLMSNIFRAIWISDVMNVQLLSRIQ
jgi:hypothetical protein